MYYLQNPKSKDAFLKRELNITLIGLIINWTENQRQLTAYSQAFSLQNKSLPHPSPFYGKSVMKTIASESISLNANLFHSGLSSSLGPVIVMCSVGRKIPSSSASLITIYSVRP